MIAPLRVRAAISWLRRASSTRCASSLTAEGYPTSLERVSACFEFGDSAAQDPRHMHLRDTDPIGDLALGEVAEKSKPHDLPLALRELGEEPFQIDAVFDTREPIVVDGDELAARRTTIFTGGRGVE